MRPILWVATIAMLASPAIGQELPCSGKLTGMGCFDAAPFSGTAEPSPFLWFGRGTVLTANRVAASTTWRFVSGPAELNAPSADPAGRLIPIVRHTTRVDLQVAFGLGRGIDVTVAQPIALSQTGAGSDALISQSPPPLASSGFGDPRISLRTRLPERLDTIDWSMRLELTMPFGAERAYLGNRSSTEAVALNGQWSNGLFSLATDVGVRVSRPVRFGDVTLGTHAFLGFGADFAPLRSDKLHVSVEGLIRPQLVRAWSIPLPRNDGEGTKYSEPSTWVMPAEWLLSVSSRPLQPDLWFSLGAGTALPLSHREATSSRVDEWFVAPSAARYQVIATVAVRN